jgi:hypothetical protein
MPCARQATDTQYGTAWTPTHINAEITDLDTHPAALSKRARSSSSTRRARDA